MKQYRRMTQVEYQKERRRKKDAFTGGHLICPGSFFPGRTGVLVGGNVIHTAEVRKRNAYHAMCDRCGIQFSLKGHIWNHFLTLPKFCGSDQPIPGVALSVPETAILLRHLTDAKNKAIKEWKEKVWINMESLKQTSLYQSIPRHDQEEMPQTHTEPDSYYQEDQNQLQQDHSEEEEEER